MFQLPVIILDVFLFFFIYAFLGWLFEFVLRSFYYKKILNPGFLHGPFLPIFGFSVLFALMALWLCNDNLYLAIFFALLFINFLEYVFAGFSEKIFGLRFWDYSTLKFNYKGRISLESSIVWALLLLILYKFIHPAVNAYVVAIPLIYKQLLLILLFSFLLVDFVLTVFELIDIRKAMKVLETKPLLNFVLEKRKINFRIFQHFPYFYKAFIKQRKNFKNRKK